MKLFAIKMLKTLGFKYTSVGIIYDLFVSFCSEGVRRTLRQQQINARKKRKGKIKYGQKVCYKKLITDQKRRNFFFSGWTFVFVGDDDSLMQFEYWWFQSVGLINLFHTHAVESKELLYLQNSKKSHDSTKTPKSLWNRSTM